MERLTKQWGNNDAVPTKFNLDFVFDLDADAFNRLNEVFNLLNAYENTGRTPEEIWDMGAEWARYKKLEAEGRLYIAPVKPDAVVWEIAHDRIYKTVLTEYFVNGNGNKLVMCLENGDRYLADEFGGKVFLTHEDAVKALKAVQL